MTKIRTTEIGNHYHSYSRGINKDNIFLEESDYRVFMRMIEKSNSLENQLTEILCYTLMSNHFHFILKEIKERGISMFFQKVLSQYVTYFNKKYDRRGPLFESRFKDKKIENDQYFEHLIVYIWNNPIKIINPAYLSKDLLNEKITLNEEEKEFAKNYPFKFFAQGTQGK